jgi:hypothetical protein
MLPFIRLMSQSSGSREECAIGRGQQYTSPGNPKPAGCIPGKCPDMSRYLSRAAIRIDRPNELCSTAKFHDKAIPAKPS